MAKGLYANINAKRARIAAFKASAKTAKKK